MQTLDSLLCRALPGCPKFTDSGLCDFCSGGVSMILPTVAGINYCNSRPSRSIQINPNHSTSIYAFACFCMLLLATTANSGCAWVAFQQTTNAGSREALFVESKTGWKAPRLPTESTIMVLCHGGNT